jgi:DNA-binding MarR family transcriptional regulator
MEKQDNSPNKRQEQDKNNRNQLLTIFHYLLEHIATASMISYATGIPQKNITRYKRDLEKAGLLWEIEKKICEHTGFRAWYLTTNEDFKTSCLNQLELFSNDFYKSNV